MEGGCQSDFPWKTCEDGFSLEAQHSTVPAQEESWFCMYKSVVDSSGEGLDKSTVGRW